MPEIDIKAESIKVLESPLYFLYNYCYTLDQEDRKNPIKKFPQKDYIEELVKIWIKQRLLLIVKSRRMMLTWLFNGLFLWDTMYHNAVNTFFISKKEDDADDLVNRSFFIYDHLPDFLKVPCRKKHCLLEFPDMNSLIKGVSQDADALRQQTATNLFSDEMAFQPFGKEALMASRPTLGRGGRFVGVSTINGKNFYFELLHDLS